MSAVVEVDAPRLVEGLPEEEYFSHPALSASGMKLLLRSPRYFHAMRNAPAAPKKKEFDVGHAAHSMVLGVGQQVVEIPIDDLDRNGNATTSKAKAFKEDAYANNQVPLKPDEYAQVVAASEAVLKHPKAGPLLEREGMSEVSLFATDAATGVGLRSRFDRLAGTLLLDLKTTTDVRRHKLERTILDFEYYLSAEVYCEMVRLVTGEEPSPMHLIFAEKVFPYEVRVVRLADRDWREAGRRKMRAAIDLFAWCSERGMWPGDDDYGDVWDIPAPAWLLASIERDLA